MYWGNNKKYNQMLVEKIWEFANMDWKTETEWAKSGRKPLKLGEHISMELSKDHFCWYITWYPDEYYNSQEYIKVLPCFGLNSKEQVWSILKAQSWVHP